MAHKFILSFSSALLLFYLGFILPTPVILIKSKSDKNINIIFMTSSNVIRNQKKKTKHTWPTMKA